MTIAPSETVTLTDTIGHNGDEIVRTDIGAWSKSCDILGPMGSPISFGSVDFGSMLNMAKQRTRSPVAVRKVSKSELTPKPTDHRSLATGVASREAARKRRATSDTFTKPGERLALRRAVLQRESTATDVAMAGLTQSATSLTALSQQFRLFWRGSASDRPGVVGSRLASLPILSDPAAARRVPQPLESCLTAALRRSMLDRVCAVEARNPCVGGADPLVQSVERARKGCRRGSDME